MNSHPFRESFQKGMIFAIIVIFMMMTGFHLIAATLASKIFGVYVLRGSVPDVRFMTYIHVPAAEQERYPPGLLRDLWLAS